MASSDWGTGSSAGLIGMRVSDQELALAEMDAETYTGTDLPITIPKRLPNAPAARLQPVPSAGISSNKFAFF